MRITRILVGLSLVLIAAAVATIAWQYFGVPIQQAVTMPGPLRGPLTRPGGVLTTDGVLQETNKQRQQNGRTPLTANTKLAAAAQAKLNDMFAKQYFEHIGPIFFRPALQN